MTSASPIEQGWPIEPLGSLLISANDLTYGIVQPGPAKAGGVPIVRVKDIRHGRIAVDEPMFVGREIESQYSRSRLSGGELLITLVGTVGEVAVAPSSMRGWNTARAVGVARIRSDVGAEWVALCLGSREAKARIASRLNTTVQATLNLKDLREVPVPLPPEAERHGIAATLRALDDKIGSNRRLADLCDRLAAALFDSLRRLPTNDLPLGEIASVVLGGTPNRARPEYWHPGSVPWLNSGKANEARVLMPSELISKDGLARSAAKLMPVGTTLIAITGATLGQIARLEIEAAGNQSLIGIWSTDSAMNDWLYYAVRARLASLLSGATGAAQQHINKANVQALQVPLPPAEDLLGWGRVVRPLLDRAAAAERESARLASMRDALLPELLAGRIRVPEARTAVASTI